MRGVNLRTAGFSGMLLSTMATSTLAFFVLAVAASEIQEEFAIGAVEIGILGAINTGVGGLFAPYAGRLSDQLGGRVSVGITLAISGVSAAWAALSSSFFLLCAAMALAGFAQGWGNPAANKAIAAGVRSEQRGIFTGIKQSGVQSAVTAAGFLVPWLTINYGWRSSLWLIVVISAISLFGLPLLTERQHTYPTDASIVEPSHPLSPFVTQVAIYGFLLGLVGGGLGRFLPLFAEEEVGFSFANAGRVFGVQGLVAIPSRLLAGVLLDRGFPARRMLQIMGVLGAVSVGFIIAAIQQPNLLWVGTILAGLSLGSWNTAANLAMIRQPNAGQATGRLIFGFLLGLTLGGPIVGFSIDALDQYEAAWIASALLALAGAALMLVKTEGEVSRYG